MKNNIFFDKNIIKSFSLLGYLSFLLIGNVLIYVYMYKFCEKYLNIRNQGLFIVFLIIGIISGFYSVYKVITSKK